MSEHTGNSPIPACRVLKQSIFVEKLHLENLTHITRYYYKDFISSAGFIVFKTAMSCYIYYPSTLPVRVLATRINLYCLSIQILIFELVNK